ncbi:MAG: hypothetical protein ABFS42_13895 [Candidatus Krumholzibacteriota bacterium]
MNAISQRLMKTGIISICLIAAVTGCSSDEPTSPPLPGVEPEVVNLQDSFQFQVTSVENYTGYWTYDWTTTGTIVNVDQSSAITAGTITLTIKDSAAKTVYSGDLSQGGSFTTDQGTTGQWRIVVSLTNGSGTLNFRTEKNQ